MITDRQANRAGTTKENLQAFLDAVQRLNAQYQPRLIEAGNMSREDYISLQNRAGDGSREEMAARHTGMIQGRKDPIYQEYDAAVEALASDMGVNLYVVDDGKRYHLDIGGISPTFNQGGDKTAPGQWHTSDSSYQIGDFVKDAAIAAVTGPIGKAVGAGVTGLLGDSVWNVGVGTLAGAGARAAAGNALSNATDNRDSFWGGMQNDQSGGTHHDPYEPWDFGGLIGDGSLINIPIPGLPFPIPGNMSWEDLVEIARRTGQTVQDVYNDIVNPEEPEDPVDAPEEEDVLIGRPGLPGDLSRAPGVVEEEEEEDEWPLLSDEEITGDPNNDETNFPGLEPVDGDLNDDPVGGWPGGPAIPGFTNPVDIPSDSTNPDDTPTFSPTDPGTPGLDGGGGSGGGFVLPGLIPILDPPDPSNTQEMAMWDYIGADTSWGIDKPDYGQVTQAPLFDMPGQPSQPNQVGYNPAPRRDYLDIVEAERRRRGLL